MTDNHTPRPASTMQVLTGAAVMFLWFGLAIAVIIWRVSQASDVAPTEDCAGWCTSDRFAWMGMAIVFGVPTLLIGFVTGLIALALLTRRAWPGVVAGTLAALLGLTCGATVVFCVFSLWTAGAGA